LPPSAHRIMSAANTHTHTHTQTHARTLIHIHAYIHTYTHARASRARTHARDACRFEEVAAELEASTAAEDDGGLPHSAVEQVDPPQ
jgi:hypothetical protein